MLSTRIITAFCLFSGLVAALLFLNERAFSLLMLGVVTLAAVEWSKLLGLKSVWSIGVYTGVIVLIGAALWYALPLLSSGTQLRYFNTMFTIMLPFWFLIVPMMLMLPTGGDRFSRTLWLSGPLLLLSAWMAMTWLRMQSLAWLLIPFVITWTADCAAYFAGRCFGKHRLAPTISPGKTWEGALGAYIGVLSISIMAYLFFPLPQKLTALNPLLAFVGLVILTAISIIGDLFESLLKRRAGVKDSGTILPGHGGVLDRIDALLATLPVFAWLSVQLIR